MQAESRYVSGAVVNQKGLSSNHDCGAKFVHEQLVALGCVFSPGRHANLTAKANSVVGSYTVTASVAGVAPAANVALTTATCEYYCRYDNVLVAAR